MKRIPLIATTLVALAVATMIALGVWQLRRADEKNALIATFIANRSRPAITFPAFGPVAPEAMFRQSAAFCVTVASWRIEAGRAANGTSGYRRIAQCRAGAEGPGLLVDVGVGRDAAIIPAWRGGQVTGVVTTEPDHNSLIARLFGRRTVLRPMLVAVVPADGLIPSQPPTSEGVANNHLAYAVQWFLFAAIAAAIYALALKRRLSRRPVNIDS